MTLGSLFDGAGTLPLAATMCGIKTLWSSEIEKYPLAVTKARFPEVIQFGDVTKINGAEIPPVDIITFGSPCQDLSVAGKRAGLAGERSGLFMEAVRIIKEMRDETSKRADEHVRPRYAVWENVPGAYSSNKGEDFRAVLEELCRVKDRNADIPRPAVGKWANAGAVVGDGYSAAWRTFDAQYWGVSQRRRRIYLVADFGGERAPEILFKREGLRGSFKTSREAWEALRRDIAEGIGATDRAVALDWLPDTDGGGSVEREYLAIALDRSSYNQGKNAKYNIGVDTEGTAFTVTAKGPGAVCYCLQGNGIDRADTAGCNGKGWAENVSYTLNTIDRHAVCYEEETQYVVRRLTPLECCRLQGMPDWWEDGVDGADSARYKMWGNGMALPNALYVMEGFYESRRAEKEDSDSCCT